MHATIGWGQTVLLRLSASRSVQSFSPLVFSTSGMGPTATTVYKRIASMMAQKLDKPYSKTLHCQSITESGSAVPLGSFYSQI